MLFATLTQFNVFLICLYAGCVVGIVWYIVKLLTKKLYKNNKLNFLLPKTQKTNLTKKQKFSFFVYHTTLCIMVVCTIFVLGIIIYFYNWGEVRLYCMFGYALGILGMYFALCKITKYIIYKKLKKALSQNN